MRRQGVFEFGLNMQQRDVRWIFFIFLHVLLFFKTASLGGG